MAAPAAVAKTGPMSKTNPVTQKQLPVWTWEGKTRTGEIRRGEMEATDESQVSSRLRAMALVNLKVKKKAFAIKFKMPGIGGIGQKDLVVFTRQFATMIDAGLPLVQCLDILAGQLDNLAFREVLTKVKQKVESGSTLAGAPGEHPKGFDTPSVPTVARRPH